MKIKFIGSTWGMIFLMTCLLGSSEALAVRTIQFMGTASSFVKRLNLSEKELIDGFACSIVIVNSGPNAQTINGIKFTMVKPNKSLVQTDAQADIVDAIYSPGGDVVTSTSSQITCKADKNCHDGDTLPANGGVYIATAKVHPIPLLGNAFSLCAGSITVDDLNASSPGSVVASGSISYIGETGTIGGQFQGALYLSGSSLAPALTNPINFAAPDYYRYPGKPGGYSEDSNLKAGSGAAVRDDYNGSGQMNMFCNLACKNSWGTNASSESGSTVTQNESDVCDTMCGNTQFGPSKGQSNNGVLVDPESGAMKFVQKTAPARFAGGTVLEMIVGPFNSICSGNRAYWDNGMADFLHIDTIHKDDNYFIGDPGLSPTKKYPPERLFCSHTHMQPPPYGYTTNGVSFSINGGRPF